MSKVIDMTNKKIGVMKKEGKYYACENCRCGNCQEYFLFGQHSITP